MPSSPSAACAAAARSAGAETPAARPNRQAEARPDGAGQGRVAIDLQNVERHRRQHGGDLVEARFDEEADARRTPGAARADRRRLRGRHEAGRGREEDEAQVIGPGIGRDAEGLGAVDAADFDAQGGGHQAARLSRSAAMAAAAAAGSGAPVIGRPITSQSAPAAIASRGVSVRA